jgi:hypothetical protein
MILEPKHPGFARKKGKGVMHDAFPFVSRWGKEPAWMVRNQRLTSQNPSKMACSTPNHRSIDPSRLLDVRHQMRMSTERTHR